MIRTREVSPPPGSGTGSEVFGLTMAQVEVIVSLLSMCLMGQRPHSSAVYDLFEMFEHRYGSDIMDEAVEATGMEITLVDRGSYNAEVIEYDRIVIEFTS